MNVKSKPKIHRQLFDSTDLDSGRSAQTTLSLTKEPAKIK